MFGSQSTSKSSTSEGWNTVAWNEDPITAALWVIVFASKSLTSIEFIIAT